VEGAVTEEILTAEDKHFNDSKNATIIVMPERICEKCDHKLGSYEHYFCSNCSAVLPQDQVLGVSVKKTYKYSASERNPNQREILKEIKGAVVKARNLFTPQELLIGAASVAVLLLTFGSFIVYKTVLDRYTPGDIAESNEPIGSVITAPVNENILDLGLSFRSEMFGSDRITDHIPAEADFYFEAHDFKSFAELFLEKDVPYKELLRASISLFADHFAVFSLEIEEERHWGAVFITRDMGLITWALEGVDEDKVGFKLMGNMLIGATHEDIFDMVESSKDRLILSIADKPDYAVSKAKLPRDGQALIIFLSEESKDAVESAVKNLSHDKLEGYMEEIVNSGYNELVIRKE
jgi:hypothetical protein